MSDLMENIKNLREVTGAGFLDCKKALNENNNNIEQSIEFLRKKGLAKAFKKSNREANEGGIGIYQNEEQTIMIEANTETDFAAKNEIFLNFIDQVGNFALKIKANSMSINDFNDQVFEGKKINDYVTDIISKIGENIVLKRIKIIKKDKNSAIFNYTHNAYRSNIGKICVLLKAEIKDHNEEVSQFGKNLCMHIAASKPMAMDVTNLDDDFIKKEKEIQIETIRSSGKPEKIIENILMGKMKKFYSEVTLLNQPFIFNPDINIKQAISEFSSNNNFNLLEYELFVLGS